MKGSEKFIETIQNYLLEIANTNTVIKDALSNQNKNIEDCITYILNTVKMSGCTGFDDQEIFDLAIEYYTNDNIEIGSKEINSQVIVNRAPILSDAEKAEAKQKAIQDLIATEKQNITKKKSVKTNNQISNPTLF